MRVLFVFNGNVPRRHTAALPADIAHLPTTHMSEVNPLLMCHWLAKRGHHITVFAPGRKPTTRDRWVIEVCAEPAAAFDALLIWKTHGLKTAAQWRLLERRWPRVVAWLDAPRPDTILGELNSRRIDVIAWGTPDLVATEGPRFPGARHVLCEHATVFCDPPALASAEPRGLYLGRLPEAYWAQVAPIARVAPMRVFALSMQIDGSKVSLRPGQYSAEDLERVAGRMPAGIALAPAVNVVREAADLSASAFGACPASSLGGESQARSASKFYDYLALGLPVVAAQTVPEARYVRMCPVLGELYAPGNARSLRDVARRALARAQRSDFAQTRAQIQQWVFPRQTYKHRARVIDECLRD